MSDVRLDYADGERRVEGADGEIPAFASLRRGVRRAIRAGRHGPGPGAHAVGSSRHGGRRIGGLPAHADVRVGAETRRFELELSRGRLVLPLTDPSWSVVVTLATDGSS